MKKTKSRWLGSGGFSLTELLFVLGISGTLSAIAAVQVSNTRNVLKADGAMRVVLSQMTAAQQMAIQQRRYVEVTFDTVNNQVILVREDTTAATTTLAAIPFEGGATFSLVAGVPDTPDAFGKTMTTSFTSTSGTFASLSGNTNVAKFAPDGTLVDWNGRTANGTIFLSLPHAAMSGRAITVLGSTGRIRGYRWNGVSWNKV